MIELDYAGRHYVRLGDSWILSFPRSPTIRFRNGEAVMTRRGCTVWRSVRDEWLIRQLNRAVSRRTTRVNDFGKRFMENVAKTDVTIPTHCPF